MSPVYTYKDTCKALGTYKDTCKVRGTYKDTCKVLCTYKDTCKVLGKEAQPTGVDTYRCTCCMSLGGGVGRECVCVYV